MRFRFSLRLVLVVTALAAIALYWLFVRPTALANRFVAAVNSGDYDTAKPMLGDHWLFKLPRNDPAAAVTLLYAEVLPREWSDLWACQRRLIFRIGRHSNRANGYVEWTEDTDVIAHINSLEIKPPQITTLGPIEPIFIQQYSPPMNSDKTLLP